MMRPGSTYMDYHQPGRGGYLDHQQQGYNGGYDSHGYGPGPSRQRPPPRTMTEPVNGYGRGDQNVYPLPHKDRSYETVTTAAGSGSSGEQAGYQTDPTSSDNSSIRRTSPPKRQEPVNDYGIGFNQPASFQPAAFNFNNGAQNNGQQQQRPMPQQNPSQSQMAPPPVPQKNGGGGMLRKTSTLKASDGGEKRKSWFARRFSKNA